MLDLSSDKAKGVVQPFGVDLARFHPLDRLEARQRLGFAPDRRYVLFASTFQRAEKNPRLAQSAIRELDDPNVVLVEFKTTIPPQSLNDLFNACDLLLLTSEYEGSPQVVKEAMACCLPIVSTPVGDVPWVFGQTPGCFLAPAHPGKLARAVTAALAFQGRTTGKERILELNLDMASVARRHRAIYEDVLENSRRC
jgi:teichuronic acid biosynthesis glycosyltransferase TuaC